MSPSYCSQDHNSLQEAQLAKDFYRQLVTVQSLEAISSNVEVFIFQS